MMDRTQSKLTASRFLRVRKLTHHVRPHFSALSNVTFTGATFMQVQDKLDKIGGGSRSTTAANTPRSSLDARSLSSVSKGRSETEPRARAEDQYEILCNDTILPLDMTLAAVRQFVWRSSAELVMHYRRKAAAS